MGAMVFFPVRHHARDGVLQALGGGQLIGLQVGVAAVVAREALVGPLELGRPRRVAASPDVHLLLAVLLRHLGLVEALQ